MELVSPDFSDGDSIPARFTCDGENVSPSLEWRDVPKRAKSLALTCEDPDAAGGRFVHWVVWGIDAAGQGIGAGEVPEGARQGINDFGEARYGGPCPPRGRGAHRYYFTLYALERSVALEERASIDDLRREMMGKAITQADLMGTYER